MSMPPDEALTDMLEAELIGIYPPVGEMQSGASPKHGKSVLQPVLVSATAIELVLRILGGGRRIVTVQDVPGIPGYGWLTIASLQHYIRGGTPRMGPNGLPLPTNGLDRHEAIIRIGTGIRGRVLIDLDRFDAWVDEQRIQPMKPLTK